MIANACMYTVHLLAGGWFLGPGEYGEFAVLLSAMLVLGVPALALQVVLARAVVRGYDPHGLRGLTIRTTLSVAALVAVAIPLVAMLARTGVVTTICALGAAPFLTLIAAGQGVLQGRGEFRALGWVLAVVGFLRAAPTVGVLAAGAGPAGGLLAGTAGAAASAVIVWVVVVWAPVRSVAARSAPVPRDAGVSAAGVLRASQVQLVLIVATSVDLLLSRTVLGEDDAGVYALGAIATKVAFWLPQAIGVVFYPRLADPARSAGSLRTAVRVVVAIGALLTVGAGLAGPLVPLVVGDDYQALSGLLWLFAATGAALSVLQVALLSAIARDRTRIAGIAWAVAAGETVVIATAVHSVAALAVVAAVSGMLAATVTVTVCLRRFGP